MVVIVDVLACCRFVGVGVSAVVGAVFTSVNCCCYLLVERVTPSR